MDVMYTLGSTVAYPNKLAYMREPFGYNDLFTGMPNVLALDLVLD